MILNKIGYSYKELTLVPATISDITSRKDCNPYTESGMLPIFTAPMLSVVNEHNMNIFEKNHILPIAPRTVSYTTRVNYMQQNKWVAFSLSEFKKLFIDEANERTPKTRYYVCVDLANGHMKKLFDTIYEAKRLAIVNEYTLCVMTGNIANPETYAWICEHGTVDAVRLGIGTGAGCFIDGTKITTKTGKKNIEDINIGDNVLTSDGTYHKVTNTLRYKTNKSLVNINNEITCTDNHKFYVIDKSKKDIVNENNLSEYAFWIEAKKLDKNKHLLIKRYG